MNLENPSENEQPESTGDAAPTPDVTHQPANSSRRNKSANSRRFGLRIRIAMRAAREKLPPILRQLPENHLSTFGRPACFYIPSRDFGLLHRIVYFTIGFLQKLPYHGAVLRFLEGIESQGRAVYRMPFCTGIWRKAAGKDAGTGAIGQVRHQQRRSAAGGRDSRRQLPAYPAATKRVFYPAGRCTAASTSITLRILAESGAESNCAAPVATARSSRARAHGRDAYHLLPLPL